MKIPEVLALGILTIQYVMWCWDTAAGEYTPLFYALQKGKPKTTKKRKVAYPWEAAGVRDDVTKLYNLRLPEPYLLKLKYIAEHTPDSMQKFCLNVIEKEIDKEIKELTK